jgi:hypothetical protein
MRPVPGGSLMRALGHALMYSVFGAGIMVLVVRKQDLPVSVLVAISLVVGAVVFSTFLMTVVAPAREDESPKMMWVRAAGAGALSVGSWAVVVTTLMGGMQPLICIGAAVLGALSQLGRAAMQARNDESSDT